MDPNANIKEQRETAAAMIALADKEEFGGEDGMTEFTRLAERLAELVQALDEWRTNGGFDPYAPEPEPQEIILFLPEPGREYGPPEATGPFALGFAEDHLTSHMTVGDGWDAQVIKLDNPNT